MQADKARPESVTIGPVYPQPGSGFACLADKLDDCGTQPGRRRQALPEIAANRQGTGQQVDTIGIERRDRRIVRVCQENKGIAVIGVQMLDRFSFDRRQRASEFRFDQQLARRQAGDVAKAGDQMAAIRTQAVEAKVGEIEQGQRFGMTRQIAPPRHLETTLVDRGNAAGQGQPRACQTIACHAAVVEQHAGTAVLPQMGRVTGEIRKQHQRRAIAVACQGHQGGEGGAVAVERRKRAVATSAQQSAGALEWSSPGHNAALLGRANAAWGALGRRSHESFGGDRLMLAIQSNASHASYIPVTQTIALVDDDRNILTSVAMALEAEGYKVACYSDSVEALRAIGETPPDLAILDIKMPRLDGMELLTRLRREHDLPVIFLTSLADETDEALGLRMGADDYITKPFSLRLLTERIRAVLRRAALSSGARDEDEDDEPPMTRDGLELDPARHRCTWKGAPVTLTVTEFLILKTLAQRPGHVKSRDQLLDAAYDENVYVDDRTIDSHIKRVRKKFRVIDKDFTHIETLYGVGYRYKET